MTPAVVLPDIPTSMSENEGLALARLADNKIVLELGAWQGYSTVCIAQTAAVTHSVDWHRGDAHAGQGSTLIPYLQHLQRYGLLAHVNVHIGRFETVLPALQDAYFDVVFLDGQHDYDSVKADAEQAVRVAKPGAVLAFHDYGIGMSDRSGLKFGVNEAVDELFTVGEVVDTLAIVRL